MKFPFSTSDRSLRIHLALADYPILREKIRAQMRRILFEKGLVTPKDFEAQVREKALRSQEREGVTNPLWDETGEIWSLRLDRIRRSLTDSYFAHYFPYDVFEQIVREVLAERVQPAEDIVISFNPELAPSEMLFDQAQAIEQLPPEEFSKLKYRHNELIVVLIRRIISDQLAYIDIAKEWITAADLIDIQRRKIGYGRIGGKAAGMLLAYYILRKTDDRIHAFIKIPQSYFVGADVMYDFMSFNELFHWTDQKYKSREQIRADYPIIQEEYFKSEFPPDIIEKFRALLDDVGNQPLIVRSSSLLEDNFGMSFAGKYESVFCPNQGTPEENLKSLIRAITRVYASVLNPDALFYRRAMKLQDYDERIALLIQVIEGAKWGKYHFPQVAGVGFSRNIYRWSPKICKEDGFLRLVWGLGTRAVERVGNDYPRLVALSHPLLQPGSTSDAIRHYSQHRIDLINLETNQLETLPVEKVLDRSYPFLRYVAQLDQGDYLANIHSAIFTEDVEKLVITLEGLLQRTSFAEVMRRILRILEEKYQRPVDTEFVLYITEPHSAHPGIKIALLQCRPQSHVEEYEFSFSENLNVEKLTEVIFSTSRIVPHGYVGNIRYVLFVPPEAYFALPTPEARSELGRAIGRVNEILADEIYICVGPGRWGTRNPDLGVHIGYADIYNTRALIELAGKGLVAEPELSYGTHFFQDLIEANIYPLAIYLDDEDVIFNRDFFYNTPNQLTAIAPKEAAMQACLRLIEVSSYKPEHCLELAMDSEKGQAVAFLKLER